MGTRLNFTDNKWYKTKKPVKTSGKREMRVFKQYPNGYDVYLTEHINKVVDKNGKEHYIHTLYNRNTDEVVKVFDDSGNCGFTCSRDEIERALDPLLKEVNQLRRAIRSFTSVKRRKYKR